MRADLLSCSLAGVKTYQNSISTASIATSFIIFKVVGTDSSKANSAMNSYIAALGTTPLATVFAGTVFASKHMTIGGNCNAVQDAVLPYTISFQKCTGANYVNSDGIKKGTKFNYGDTSYCSVVPVPSPPIASPPPKSPPPIKSPPPKSPPPPPVCTYSGKYQIVSVRCPTKSIAFSQTCSITSVFLNEPYKSQPPRTYWAIDASSDFKTSIKSYKDVSKCPSSRLIAPNSNYLASPNINPRLGGSAWKWIIEPIGGCSSGVVRLLGAAGNPSNPFNRYLATGAKCNLVYIKRSEAPSLGNTKLQFKLKKISS